MMQFHRVLVLGAMMAGMSGPAVAEAPLAKTVQIFAHRGASALRPEHTLASYAKAIVDGCLLYTSRSSWLLVSKSSLIATFLA